MTIMKLLAASPKTFFVDSVLDVTFEFETDPLGNGVALALVQGASRQRAVKVK